MDAIRQRLSDLREQGNYRSFPKPIEPGMIDLSSNDYLGLAAVAELLDQFWSKPANRHIPLTSSASRLLAGRQQEYDALESKLSHLYGRPALLFNSGYHANTGIVSALADKRTVIIADKLVHASIIDGIRLSGSRFERFRHNDMAHLSRLVQANAAAQRLIIIVESVYSMDGDTAPLDQIVELKRQHPQALLMVDEAHAFGVLGEHGLGLAQAYGNEVDVIVGTLGKALASVGAFCITSDEIRSYLINTARSLIFSTSIPPLCCAWSAMMIDRMVGADDRRRHLLQLAEHLHEILSAHGSDTPISHIQPLIIGDARRAVALAAKLREQGVIALPIRVPTVPPGTERIRFSLSAALTHDDLDKLARAL